MPDVQIPDFLEKSGISSSRIIEDYYIQAEAYIAKLKAHFRALQRDFPEKSLENCNFM